ncbi:hypothetical protein OHA91_01145 [Streptomyces erythrochromogenes]|uniref:Uncharacterized protein n=1 Tax=Streptomyces erythrochromogenes TaxID=285574 RepID=A0ABZ1Q3F1_9ACTN|nr:hypothetical protein [Streptomyces erythrochromogenes]MCX5583965.1 hypothetical protein [Streptomyces erythrochromogenes]
MNTRRLRGSGYRNRWWTLLKLPDGTIGRVSNISTQGGEKIAGVPDFGCGQHAGCAPGAGAVRGGVPGTGREPAAGAPADSDGTSAP